MTKLMVPVLCFHYFMVNSNAPFNRSATKFTSHIYHEPQPCVRKTTIFLMVHTYHELILDWNLAKGPSIKEPTRLV
jgi:hypothetical protein